MADRTGPRKVYGEVGQYERKLARVMERLAVDDYNWNHDRHGAWVQFRYKGQLYAFEHTVEKAKQRDLGLHFGSDCFAQLVFALEDIARLVERGIYDLQTWVSGLKALPAASALPDWCKVMGFAEPPPSLRAMEVRFAELVLKRHPDHGGTNDEIRMLYDARKAALATLAGLGGEGS